MLFSKKITTEISIDGMMCEHCAAHVKEALEKVLPNSRVSVDHREKKAVILSKAPADPETIRKAVTDAGYTFIGIKEV